MNRTLALSALLLASLLGITACASGPADTGATNAPQKTAEVQDSAADAGTSGMSETTMPPGARPGSVDFPFPVPEDWMELEPFAEGKIGKTAAMSAAFVHPGDAQSAAKTYQQLLKQAGFTIHPNPLGEQVNDASFLVTGKVAGTAYAGGLDFDTDSTGTKRVSINLRKD